MNESERTRLRLPLTERLVALDALRGAALLGVLLVNLEVGFRVSLFQQMLTPHMHAGGLNYAVDILIAGVFEFKAFSLFSFIFGIGIAVQAERTAAHGGSVTVFLLRRFAVLLLIGLAHLLLVWNGDILTLYAICGLLLVPLVKCSTRVLAALGLGVIVLAAYVPLFGWLFPAAEAMRAHAALATQIYAHGGWTEILALRWSETWHFIVPLLLGSLPRTFGLMLLGIACWRARVLTEQYGKLLRNVFIVAGSLGALTTTLQIRAQESGHALSVALDWLAPFASLLLALGYGAGLWLWLKAANPGCPARWLAAGGRMALSNYLAQSVLFSLLFYGYGLGLFGKLNSAAAALLGVTVFVMQLLASRLWLRLYQFGPAEWLWRSLTYGRWQPLRRLPIPAATPSSVL
jgi:uncharacterized protein